MLTINFLVSSCLEKLATKKCGLPSPILKMGGKHNSKSFFTGRYTKWSKYSLWFSFVNIKSKSHLPLTSPGSTHSVRFKGSLRLLYCMLHSLQTWTSTACSLYVRFILRHLQKTFKCSVNPSMTKRITLLGAIKCAGISGTSVKNMKRQIGVPVRLSSAGDFRVPVALEFLLQQNSKPFREQIDLVWFHLLTTAD